jgi:hypothetical protein
MQTSRPDRARTSAAAIAGMLVVVGLLLSPWTSDPAPAAAARTALRLFTPFAADGGLRPGIVAHRRSGGGCHSGSFVSDSPTAHRCFSGNLILDPCYREPHHSTRARVVFCVDSPWDRSAIRLGVSGRLRTSPRKARGGPPWALQLITDRRCVYASGATTVVRGSRLNYFCIGGRYLFGSPDRRRPLWRIREARDRFGAGMRMAGIKVAWR